MIPAQTLNELAVLAARDSKEHGFRDHAKPVWRTFVKACCEIAEAVEAYRDNRYASTTSFINAIELSDDNKYSEQIRKRIFQKQYEQFVKNTVQDELADVFIYILDAAGNIQADLSVPNRMTAVEVETMRQQLRREDFITNAGRLMLALLKTKEPLMADRETDVWKKLIHCLDYITEWASIELGQDILYWVTNKMKYNHNRPYRHGRKEDPTL